MLPVRLLVCPIKKKIKLMNTKRACRAVVPNCGFCKTSVSVVPGCGCGFHLMTGPPCFAVEVGVVMSPDFPLVWIPVRFLSFW